MKYFTILISILICSCGLTKNSSAIAQNSESTMVESAKLQDDIRVTYSAITRGSFLEIKIQNQEILVKKEQNRPDKIQDLSEMEWELLMNKLDAIKLDTLSTLEAPSMKRAYDGAASAKLQITEDDLVYSTPEFDHGNPNSEIKPLVEYILSLSEKIE